MTTFHITTTHTRRTIATLEHIPYLDMWICEPSWADMTQRKVPVDGYSFKAPGEWASVHRASFHEALLRLAERGEYTISIKGILYLRRLRDDPVLPPQPMQPFADAEGFSMTDRR